MLLSNANNSIYQVDLWDKDNLFIDALLEMTNSWYPGWIVLFDP